MTRRVIFPPANYWTQPKENNMTNPDVTPLDDYQILNLVDGPDAINLAQWFGNPAGTRHTLLMTLDCDEGRFAMQVDVNDLQALSARIATVAHHLEHPELIDQAREAVQFREITDQIADDQ